jgi:rare lipoprotein A
LKLVVFLPKRLLLAKYNIMKKLQIILLLIVSIAFSFAATAQVKHPQVGIATFYHKKFEGHKTSSGERYRSRLFTAAHRTLAFGTMVKVTSLKTGKWVIVRINDRGPFVKHRIIDLSRGAAEELDIIGKGSHKVKVEIYNGTDLPIHNEPPVELAVAPSDARYFNISIDEDRLMGFAVQIASYNDMDNLLDFLSKIDRTIKQQLITQVSIINDKRVYRLLVGQFVSRADADTYAEKHQNLFPGCFSIEIPKEQSVNQQPADNQAK